MREWRDPRGTGIARSWKSALLENQLLTTARLTGARPDIPIARAPAGVRSITRPRTNGPRSLIRTTTDLLFRVLVTRTMVPNGSLRCAAVSAPDETRSPLAERPPLYPSPFDA